MEVFVVVGTRPEAIKLAPVILELWGRGHTAHVCTTGQQPDVGKFLLPFGITPAITLDAGANHITPCFASCLTNIWYQLNDNVSLVRPDFVIGQGDTTSAMAAAHAAFDMKIPFCHVEAGLRTGDLSEPFPEERNRRAIANNTTLHCCPTEDAMANLRAELADGNICVTGNTSIDAARMVRDNMWLDNSLTETPSVVITMHRRENWDKIPVVARSISRLADEHPAELFVWVMPRHPTPAREASANLSDKVQQIQELSHKDFINMMDSAKVVVTDSGGLQEECAYLKTRTLVVRDATERDEAILYGTASLVQPNDLQSALPQALLEADVKVNGPCPFGDGYSSVAIVDALEKQLI